MDESFTCIGLNEFNLDLLNFIAADKPKLVYLNKLCQMQLVNTYTHDVSETELLEPWVQWVGVQTGLPSSVHHVKYLGDVSNLTDLQVWERLSKVGRSSLVWGAMNATRGSAENCKVFVPDPWAFDVLAHPGSNNEILELPRYLAKHYSSLSKTRVLGLFIKFLARSLFSAGASVLMRAIKLLTLGMIKFGPKHFVFISVFEFISTAIFCRAFKNAKADFNFYFLNSIAHVQHHYWRSTKIEDLGEIEFAYEVLDQSLSLIDQELGLFFDNKPLIICNALTQSNSSLMEDWYLYRVRNMSDFLAELSIPFSRVETLMSYDGHIFCDTVDEFDKCLVAMKNIEVDGARMFVVDPDPAHRKLFFRISFNGDIDGASFITLAHERLPFGDHVEKIVRRTGRHDPRGCILHNLGFISHLDGKEIMNHEIFGLIYPEIFCENQSKGQSRNTFDNITSHRV